MIDLEQAEKVAYCIERAGVLCNDTDAGYGTMISDTIRNNARNRFVEEAPELMLSMIDELTRLRGALTVYANPVHWQCARCGKQDALNCFNSKWVGPLMCNGELSDTDADLDSQPWALAARTLEAA